MAPSSGSNGNALYLTQGRVSGQTLPCVDVDLITLNGGIWESKHGNITKDCQLSLEITMFADQAWPHCLKNFWNCHWGFLLLIIIAASDGLQLLESLGDVAARVLRGRHRRRRGGRRGGESLLGAGEDAVVEPGRRRGGAVLRLEWRRVRYLCMIWHDVLVQGKDDLLLP